uniref:hypothetical protein n=1 Tax=Limosilactobacillus sp. TaxID=2773925 RepID=UPI0035A1544A
FLANWYELKPSVAHSRTSFTLNSELYLVIKSAPQSLDLCLTIMGHFKAGVDGLIIDERLTMG